ncbi:hypothetical protein [Candidatus Electronema sp. JM]|uniref:hypothetical protein n=1 Tax=Candidatus Electronema sp. JM TaxID=3401571 RepID=UPI003AA9DB17
MDEVINSDRTFHPFNLKQVIIALDIGLMENFYNLPWPEAMQKVHDEIQRTKNSYLSKHKNVKIDGIRKLLNIAKEEDFYQEDIIILKEKLFKEMNSDHENDNRLFIDRQFLQLIITQQVDIDRSNEDEISRMRKFIQIAKEEELDNVDICFLKEKLFKELNSHIDYFSAISR